MAEQTELIDSGSSAILSACGRYRYRLERRVGPSDRPCVFIMLNPSTADATANDKTIRRCMSYAVSLGCGRLVVVNLFAFRATKPRELLACGDPIGEENDDHIMRAAEETFEYYEGDHGVIVCAWGVPGVWKGRSQRVLDLLAEVNRPLYALGLNKDGSPKHPLYLRADVKLVPFRGSVAR